MSSESEELRRTAAKCRSLALAVDDRRTAVSLEELALDYEHRADRMEESERRLREAEAVCLIEPRQDR